MTAPPKSYALVTGASSGLGLEFANQLAERGHNLILTARRKDRLDALKAELEKTHGIDAPVIVCDLASPNAAKKLHDRIKAKKLTVDIVVNNAGFGVFGNYAEIEWQRENTMLQVDIVALAQLTKLFTQDMLARGQGHVLLISSIGAYQATPYYASYAAAKAFVLMFGEAIGYELRRNGVKVTVLSPGVTATEFLAVSGQRPTLYQRLFMMDAPKVVRIGLNAMFRGKPSVIPGLGNKIAIWSNRFAPRRLQTSIAAKFMKN